MKKLKMIVFAFMASLLLVSCTEYYVKKYESACKDGDSKEAAVYAAKLLEKELNDDQKKRVENAALDLLKNEMNNDDALSDDFGDDESFDVEEEVIELPEE